MRRKYLFVSTSLLVIFSMIAVIAIAMLWKPERKIRLMEIVMPSTVVNIIKGNFKVNPSPQLACNDIEYARKEKLWLQSKIDSIRKVDSVQILENGEVLHKEGGGKEINILNILVSNSNDIFYYELSNVRYPEYPNKKWDYMPVFDVSLHSNDIHYCPANQLTSLLLDFRLKKEKYPECEEGPMVCFALSDHAKFEDLLFIFDNLNLVDQPRYLLRKITCKEDSLINSKNAKGLSIHEYLKVWSHYDSSLEISNSSMSQKYNGPFLME